MRLSFLTTSQIWIEPDGDEVEVFGSFAPYLDVLNMARQVQGFIKDAEAEVETLNDEIKEEGEELLK